MKAQVSTTEAAIWSRIIDPASGTLSPQAARTLLRFDFSVRDRECMEELAAKARAGNLTPSERQAAESYNRVGHLLALLHSKARQSLKCNSTANQR